jgi:hypothetical protein
MISEHAFILLKDSLCWLQPIVQQVNVHVVIFAVVSCLKCDLISLDIKNVVNKTSKACDRRRTNTFSEITKALLAERKLSLVVVRSYKLLKVKIKKRMMSRWYLLKSSNFLFSASQLLKCFYAFLKHGLVVVIHKFDILD